MAAISGLQSPNPYAQPATRAPTRTPAVPFTATVVDHAVPHHPAYSPDWMQADHTPASQTTTAGIYSIKGELQKLPSADFAANQAATSNSPATDSVTLSADSTMHY